MESDLFCRVLFKLGDPWGGGGGGGVLSVCVCEGIKSIIHYMVES